MTEHLQQHPASATWIDRCAQRLLRHHIVTPEEAAELARELHASIGGRGCPEQLADDLFRMPLEV
jgi:hypothetical protein